MLSLILLGIGAVLYFRGRIKIGSINAEGKHVKSAGIILMLPAFGSFLLGLVIGTLFEGNVEMLLNLVNILFVVELVGAFLAAFVAYRIIVNPTGSTRLPGIFGDLQSQQPQQPRKTVTIPAPDSPAESSPAPKIIKPILSLQEAAEYLKITEADVLRLIDEGKLTAARVNYRYQIARSQLDDYLNTRELT
jgi:excisionase family DNA binding protein